MARRSERVSARGGARLLRGDLHVVQAELKRIREGGGGSKRASLVMDDLRMLWRGHRQALSAGLNKPEWERVSVALQLARAPTERVDQTVLETQRGTVDAAVDAVDAVLDRLELGRSALVRRRIRASLRPAPQRGAVSLDDLARAYFLYQRAESSEPEAAEQAAFLYQLALGRFQAEHGQIIKQSFAEDAAAAVVLTAKPRRRLIRGPLGNTEEVRLFRSSSPVGELTPEDAELLYEMDVLALQLSEVLTGPPARIGLTQLLTLMRFITAPSAKFDRASLRDELGSLRDYYERAGVQIARIAYASGVIFGFFSLCAVAIVVGAVSRLLGADPHALAVALTAILGAGSAATLSAFVRMGLGGSLVRHPIGRGKMRILGGLRPVVGGILGLFVWLLLSWFGLSDEYVILAAVVSGFGERFFLIMLEPVQVTTGPETPAEA